MIDGIARKALADARTAARYEDEIGVIEILVREINRDQANESPAPIGISILDRKGIDPVVFLGGSCSSAAVKIKNILQLEMEERKEWIKKWAQSSDS